MIRKRLTALMIAAFMLAMLLAVPAVAHAADFFVYSELDTSLLAGTGSYGVEAYVGADGVDRVIFFKDAWPESIAYIYTVTIPAGADPNAHPDNPDDPGAIAPRTFALETSFPMGYTAGHGNEFYVDAANDVIYCGADQGIKKYVRSGASYVYDSDVAPATDPMYWTQSLAYDPGTNTWYAGEGGLGAATRAVLKSVAGAPWEVAFTYAAPVDGMVPHHDGMEFIDGSLYLAEYEGNLIHQFLPDGTLVNEFTHAAFAMELEGMGYDALGHFWCGSHGSVITEFGGGKLVLGGTTVESDCFSEQRLEIPVETAFTIGHKLKVSVDDVSILLGRKLLPGDSGSGSFKFKVWSNDDVEASMTNGDFVGDDKGVNDEAADTLNFPMGVRSDWGPEAKYDDDELAPFTMSADRLSIALNGAPYTKGTWATIHDGPTGEAGVECSVDLALSAISYSDHAGYYTGQLLLDVRQF